MKKGKFYVTTPIYYVNDKPHIGHAYTTIAADVIARWHRLKGNEVFFLTGTDEHGAKVAQSAKEAGKSPQDFCDENSQKFKDTFENLNLSFDYFVRTTGQRHQEAVAKFMQNLYDNGDIYEGTYEGLYCNACENFLTEKELVDGRCPYHQKEPEKISEKNYFFQLKKYLPQVKKLIEQDEIIISPSERKAEALGLIKQGLEDFSVSRERVKWGIPLPFDKSQVTYVWVEALQNYLSAIGYGDNPKEYEKWWLGTETLHLMAKDILKFHCIYWPALLLAAQEKLPKELFLHGFFTINGQKMSKSLGNVIDPNNLVKKYGTDATRYLLLSQFPFGKDGDIKEEKFAEQYNADLANGLGNLVSRITNLIEKNKVEIKKLKEPIPAKQVTEINNLIKELNFYEALNRINLLIAEANKYIDESAPWKLEPDDKKLSEILSNLSQRIKIIAKLLLPFIPSVGKDIISQFEEKEIKKGKPLFPRI